MTPTAICATTVSTSHTWDNESNPVTVDGNPITYDALNRRVEYYNSSVGYVQYLWAPYDSGRKLVIESSAGQQVQLLLPGGGQAMVGPSGVTNYRRPNWQGSQPIDSTPSQTADVDAAFTPYGEHYAENGYLGYFGGNLSIYPFFMDGYASTTRLYHYEQGRWISPDPAGLSAVDPTNPQTWNRYAYVAGNPLNSTDPSGLIQSAIPPPASIFVPPWIIACGGWGLYNPSVAGDYEVARPPLGGVFGPNYETPPGGGRGGGSSTATTSTIRKVCLDQFYQSPVGKVVETASPLQMIPGWGNSPAQSITETVIGGATKVIGVKSVAANAGKPVIQTIFMDVGTALSPLSTFFGQASEKILQYGPAFAKTLWLDGASLDVLAHAGCGTIAEQEAGQMTAVGNAYIP